MADNVPVASDYQGAADLTMIRLLIADNDQFAREGISSTMERDCYIHVVAQAGDGRAAVEAARRYAPDLVLLDLLLPRLSGLTAAENILALPHSARVVILTTPEAMGQVADAIRIGVSGFLLKDTPPLQLIEAVRAVSSGQGVLSPAVTGRVLKALQDRTPTVTAEQRQRLALLTSRERAVLALLTTGQPNTAIAGRLDISEATVKGHVTRILAKTGAANRVQAALVADRIGLDILAAQ